MSVAFPYKCAACKARFALTRSAERHIHRKHGGIGIIVYDHADKRRTFRQHDTKER